VSRRLALAVVDAVYRSREAPFEIEAFARDLDLPREWVDMVAGALVESGVVRPISEDGLAPLRPAAELSVWAIFRVVDGLDEERSVPLPAQVEECLSRAAQEARVRLDSVSPVRQ
jgi:DNA-binding IscR family transcriptional regulator